MTLRPLLFAAAFSLFLLLSKLASAAEADRISVLFLGDRGHHRPYDRAVQLTEVMRSRGIDVTYTEELADLNAKTLARHQALIVYANIERIAPPQEAALLEYVTGGGGLVTLHCGSFCFLNSPKYVALVGGQFKSHGTGQFDTNVVTAEHPIMRGLRPFMTWDETYVHHLHNEKGRTVLQTRGDGAAAEPWTWVRDEGRGRVFYTAYGHDGRTWGNPGFYALVERGIRWAARRDVFDTRFTAPKDAKPFEYAQAKLPNYVPSTKWGEQGASLDKMQLPLSPAESMKHVQLPAGFRLELFAAESEIGKPIAMCWDERGRLWIAETVDYPNELQKPGAGRDRIRICEDTDGDGQADKFTVFADKLSIPTSILCARGGLIVHQAPQTLFLKDTDGDDQADVREVLLDGWKTNDTHAGPSNLRYGFDNWIYSMVGYAGFEGTVGGEKHQFRQGFFRFKSDGSKLEFLRSVDNNCWGVGFSEEGLLFGSTANGNPSVYLPIANRYYEQVRGWSPSVLGHTAINNRLYPITEKVRQVDHHGGFTAAAGHALYTARNYPKAYWNRAAFVCEPTAHLVATLLLEKHGSDFVSHNAFNLLASQDEWSAPIAAEVGPDGNVWVIDWYNYVVQHNPTPQGFKTGKGNAYETDHRDKKHGRIYRLVYGDAKGYTPPKLDAKDPAGLVKALKSDVQQVRLTAQRLLVEREKHDDVVAAVAALVDDRSVDAIGLNVGAIHALWTMNGWKLSGYGSGEKDPFFSALSHPSAAVRMNALQVAPPWTFNSERLFGLSKPVRDFRSPLPELLRDLDPHVRLAALMYLARLPRSPGHAREVVQSLTTNAGLTLNEPWLRDAAIGAAARHNVDVLGQLCQTKEDKFHAALDAVVVRIAEHSGRQAVDEDLRKLLAAMEKGQPKIVEGIVTGLARGWPKDRKLKMTEADERRLAALVTRVPASSQGQLVSLAERWGAKSLEKHAEEIAASLRKSLADEKQSVDARLNAARQLVQLLPKDAKLVGELLEPLTPRLEPELATGLVDAAARSQSPEAGELFIARIGPSTPAVRAALLKALVSRKEWTESLLAAVEKEKLSLRDLTLEQQQALAAYPDKAVAERAKKLLARGGNLPNADRQKVLEELAAKVLEGGDVTRGKAVFKTQCAKCHTHSGEGSKIGPDLTGMAVHPRHELLTAIIDPSRSVEGNFLQYSAVTDDGLVINGLLASESKTAIELIDIEGKKHAVQRENLESLKATKKSIMPEGFEKQVPPEGVADLLAFLTQRGKYLPLDLRKVASAVSTRGMFYSEDADAERLIFTDWSPKTFNGVPFYLVDPLEGRVKNAVLLHSINGKLPPTMPKSVTLPVNAPAKAIHLLSGVSGWGYAGNPVRPTTSLIVRLHYKGGGTEDHALKNGVHFADYIRVVDVPESKLAFKLRGQQLRYLAVTPKKPDVIKQIELVKGEDATAPIVMAATVEGE